MHTRSIDTLKNEELGEMMVRMSTGCLGPVNELLLEVLTLIRESLITPSYRFNVHDEHAMPAREGKW